MAITKATLGQPMSKRQVKIHNLMVTTADNNFEIGKKVFISDNAVRYHLGQIFLKLGCTNRLQLMVNYNNLRNAG